MKGFGFWWKYLILLENSFPTGKNSLEYMPVWCAHSSGHTTLKFPGVGWHSVLSHSHGAIFEGLWDEIAWKS